MSDAGYTLSETLAALAVISLAMGGLSFSVQILAPLQRSTELAAGKLQAVRSAQTDLTGLLARAAPFDSENEQKLSGGPESFRFDCAAPQPCKVSFRQDKPSVIKIFDGFVARELDVGAGGEAHFRYVGSSSASEVWPPSAPGHQVLRSISLVSSSDSGELPILQAKIWREQSATCAFDSISQACR